MGKTLWVLTEERPKKPVVEKIVRLALAELEVTAEYSSLRVIPSLDSNGFFTGTYLVMGIDSKEFDNVKLRVVSGNSSFVDYLVYLSASEPSYLDRPVIVVEETKTDDGESRNTGIFQRASKFVYVEKFYPGVPKFMLYNLQVDQAATTTKTNNFGTRCFYTLGVRIIGKANSGAELEPFRSVDEMIEARRGVRKPPAGNVPIEITKISANKIQVSGRLVKDGRLGHDPNIGALTLISSTLRKLGWSGVIEITSHGLSQKMLGAKNKFVQLANLLDLKLEGLTLPKSISPAEYWRYEVSGEKLGTIFVHLVVEEFSTGHAIYENHAGGERGYFYTSENVAVPVSKRLVSEDGLMHADAEVIPIPDLIILDVDQLEVLNIEGERAENVLIGITQLKGFKNIEEQYISKYYPAHKVIRSVVLYGGDGDQQIPIQVGLLVASDGRIVLGVEAPNIMRKSIESLFEYWRNQKTDD